MPSTAVTDLAQRTTGTSEPYIFTSENWLASNSIRRETSALPFSSDGPQRIPPIASLPLRGTNFTRGRRFRVRACREGTSVPCRRSERDRHRLCTAWFHRGH